MGSHRVVYVYSILVAISMALSLLRYALHLCKLVPMIAISILTQVSTNDCNVDINPKRGHD
jgi:hypothetical protein